MSEQHTYAGHTLAEIKAAAELAQTMPWEKSITEVPYRAKAEFLALANPSTVLSMAARIEYLESAWHVETMERKDAIIAKQEIHNDELKARIAELERERDAAVEARREAQMETQLAREARNRSGVEAGKEMRKQVKAARLEGWRAARETAANLAEQKLGVGWIKRDIRAMQPPAEWSESCSCGDRYPAGSDGALHIAKEGKCENCHAASPKPAEWAGAQNGQNTPESPVIIGNGVGGNWPHPDGFAGGLTERSE